MKTPTTAGLLLLAVLVAGCPTNGYAEHPRLASSTITQACHAKTAKRVKPVKAAETHRAPLGVKLLSEPMRNVVFQDRLRGSVITVILFSPLAPLPRQPHPALKELDTLPPPTTFGLKFRRSATLSAGRHYVAVRYLPDQLRAQAEEAFRLAQEARDRWIAKLLEDLGRQLHERADQLENEEDRPRE